MLSLIELLVALEIFDLLLLAQLIELLLLSRLGLFLFDLFELVGGGTRAAAHNTDAQNPSKKDTIDR